MEFHTMNPHEFPLTTFAYLGHETGLDEVVSIEA
jgi:hypothetical protein